MKVPAARIVFPESDRAEVARATADILASGALTLGPHTRRFEEAFAARHQVKHALAVTSGTAALEIALRCVGVQDKDVIVPTNTFFATAMAVIRAGARPVFADVDRNSMALNAETLTDALTDNTAAVVHVHIGGYVAPDIDAVARACRNRNIELIEDAAHAQGSAYDGRPAGNFGRVGAFSFYPTKVITSGEGGMLVTNDDHIAEEAKIYRDQGKQAFIGNMHVREGYAWRMSELNALTGEVHLRRLDEFMKRRNDVAARFTKELTGLPGLRLVDVPEASLSNFYKYVVFLPDEVDRQEFKTHLREKYDVSLSGEVYDLPLHQQPVFEQYADRSLPAAEQVCRSHICLPLFSDMSDVEVDYTVESFTNAYRDSLG